MSLSCVGGSMRHLPAYIPIQKNNYYRVLYKSLKFEPCVWNHPVYKWYCDTANSFCIRDAKYTPCSVWTTIYIEIYTNIIKNISSKYMVTPCFLFFLIFISFKWNLVKILQQDGTLMLNKFWIKNDIKIYF